jgi:hypothetical protein
MLVCIMTTIMTVAEMASANIGRRMESIDASSRNGIVRNIEQTGLSAGQKHSAVHHTHIQNRRREQSRQRCPPLDD